MRGRGRRRPATRARLEALEDRLLLAAPSLSALVWTPVGPAPIEPSATSGDAGNDADAINTGLGPNPVGIFSPVTGRIDSIAASPTDPNTIYIAAAGGGVWKTTDGGTNWTPLTDSQATLSMGKIALAPSNPNIIYAGTGDSEANLDGGGNLDSRMTPGRGILKSTDGGQSWTLLGSNLFDRREIGGVVVDPNDPNTVYVSVADYVPGSIAGNTGVWKSTDGGQTWTNMTSSATANVAPGDSFLGLVMDPTNSQVLYAAASDISGNAGNGIYKTTDGGVHWTVAGNFPVGGTTGRIALAGSPTNNQVLYAGVADSTTGLVSFYQTSDAGAHWTLLGGIPQIINPAGSQAFYDLAVAVDPNDPTGNTFYAAGQAGADSIIRVVVTPGSPPTTTVLDVSGGANAPHPDHHALAFDASGHLLDGNDGGIWRLDTVSPAVSWTDLNGNLGITQFIGIAADPTSSAIVLGGSQDNGTEISNGAPAWSALLGGDGGYTQIDQSNSSILYHEFFGISLERSDNGGATWTNINPPTAANGLFYVPYVLDPNTSKRLVYGTDTLYETTDATATPPVWTAIGTPGTAGFNPGAGAITAEAISASNPNTIYVTTESQVFMTKNDGATWTNVSIPGVSTGLESVTVDPFNNLVAYVTRDQYGDGKVFRTSDGGATWTDISGNLPDEPAHTLVIDSRTSPETLFLGNNIGVYASFNQGVSWVRYSSGLPNVQVKQLVLQLNGGVNVLDAGTYGRGVYQIQADTPLVVTAIAPTGAVEGQAFGPVEVATFTDPTPGVHTAASYAATIDWGDGTSTAGQIIEDASGVFHVSGGHTYAEEGTQNLTVMVASTGGSNGGASIPVKVADAPLTAQAAAVTGVEAHTLGSTAKPPGTDVLVASFTDADPNGAVADYTASIQWGDGTSSAATRIVASGGPNGTVFSVYAQHLYLEEGSYPLVVTINDAGGSQALAHGTAAIVDAPLTADPAQPSVNTVEALLFPVPVFGTPMFNGPVVSFTDTYSAAPASDFHAVIDWGDGTPQSAGILQSSGVPGQFYVMGGHTYADSQVNGGASHFTITVHITDVGGAKLIVHNTAVVADNPIILSGRLDPSSDSGTSAVDAITNVSSPRFYGHTEPLAHVELYAKPSGGGVPIFLGLTQASGNGTWHLTSTKLPDGSYTITAVSVDQFGKTTSGPVQLLPNANQGPLVIDTVGPRIANVVFDRLNGQVDVTFKDDRSGLNLASVLDSVNYSLTRPHTPPATYLVTGIKPTVPASPTGALPVVLTFNGGKPIPGGFYTFVIRSYGPSNHQGIRDVAGNALDGEFYGAFPSGNSERGGDFVAMLDAYHQKVFAPQTVAGTASAANGGNGGLPVGAPHSGNWTPVRPRQHVMTPLATAGKVTVKMAGKAPGGPLKHA